MSFTNISTSGGVGSTVEVSEIETLSKGSLIAGDGSGAPTTLAVGANNLPLVADSAQTAGLKYAALTVAGGGTGAVTLTGLVKGNGTSAMTAASAGTDYYAPGSTDVALADGGTGASLVDPNADRIMFWDDSAGSVAFLTPSTGLTITTTSIAVDAATTTNSGIAEAAIASEVDTGTDAARYVTPDALAGSVMGSRTVEAVVFDFATNTATGDGKFYFTIPEELNGMNLIGVHARVITAGTTNTTDIQIANVTDAVDILSTKLTIDSAETSSSTAATPAVIDTSKDDVATNDLLRIDVDAVSTTPAVGLLVRMRFQLP